MFHRVAVPTLLMLSAMAAHGMHIGPIQVQPVAALYLVSDGQGANLAVTVSFSPRAYRPMPQFLLRVLDPDEQMLHWRYVEYHTADTLPEVEVEEGIELPVVERRPGPHEVLHQVNLKLEQAGVYQVRISTASSEVLLDLESDRELGWGISGQNGDFLPWPGQGPEAFVWVPPHAELVQLRGGPCAVVDERGGAVAELPAQGSADVPVQRTETIWRVRFPNPADWKLRAAGMPFILCNSERAARDIHASAEMLDDGTVVCHKFQVRIAQVLRQILARERVGDTEQLVQDLAARREAWLADPLRNALLATGFLSVVEPRLRSQNLDANSHWGGSLDGWQDRINRPAPENRWDRFREIEGLRAGASSDYGCDAEALALAALHDHPANPYYGKTELLYRAAAAGLRDLMVLQEDETWPGISDLDPYPGNMAFVAVKSFPVFGLAAPHLPEEVRSVWAEGLQHLRDRSFPDGLTSARNQSSHYLPAYQAFADGTGRRVDAAMARLYGARFLREQSPAGYDMEACGPCASYIGMTHYHQAWYWRMSGDPAILQALRNSYTLFNHTVGPEPDGRILGGFNFNHRVGDGFFLEQYSGAKGILDDVLPEVGVWAGPPPSETELAAKREQAIARINSFLANPRPGSYSWRDMRSYLYYAEPDRSGCFPCQEPGPFIRNFADEFIFVKRPGYYAALFVGAPAGEYYIRKRVDFRAPFANNAESTGGEVADIRKSTPFGGGGLTGLWTPDYGHSILATNWAPTCHHGLVATDSQGLRWWEDYHGHSFELDADAGTLVIRGRIEGQPIRYVRSYTFGDEALGVRLQLSAEADLSLAALVENIPYARWEWKARGADAVAGEAREGETQANSFCIVDRTGAGVMVTLSEVMPLRLVPQGLKTPGWRRLQIGRVEIVLPARWSAGQEMEISYEVKPLKQ